MADGDDSMEQGRSLPSAVDWSNLPDDLLGMIRSRFISRRGRARFAATCRSWRAAPAPPALPLLLLSAHSSGMDIKKNLYCPEEREVLRFEIPGKLRNTRIRGCYDGGWVAAVTTTPPVTFAIFNLFSGVEVPLSREQKNMPWVVRSLWDISKVIFSDVPTSGDCVLAAMTHQRNTALCRVGSPDAGWVVIEICDRVVLDDIVFFHGALYGLTHNSQKLFKFDISFNEDAAPPLVVGGPYIFDVHWHGYRIESPLTTSIFELHGKLAVAMMALSWENNKPFFKVFQLDVAAHTYTWKEVVTLGDSALFLGRSCSSRVLHVQAGGRGGVTKNHIYYSDHWHAIFYNYPKFRKEAYLARSEYGESMYCCLHQKSRDGVEGIPSVGHYMTNGMDYPLWCFPPDY
jgi:hypothetical protein